MADPTAPAGTQPAAQPKVKSEIEQRYDEAGYARNRAELAYKTAVKEHGKDSPEAKTAKDVLSEKQAAVEAIQAEMRGPKPAPKVVAKAPAKPAKTEELKEIVVELPKLKTFNFDYFKLIERPKAAYIYEVRSEMLIRRDFSQFLDTKKIKEFQKCVDKATKEKKDTTPCAEKLLDIKPVELPKHFLEKALLTKT